MILDYKQIKIETLADNFLKEYISFKEENLDAILFFQIGDFYEIFFQDAKIFSEITGALLTSRRIKDIGEIAQAGIPVKSVNLYLKKLLNENFKICICEQYKDKNNEYHRKIIRKYTKGTLIENEFLEANDNNYILAVFEKNDICYMSYCDVSTGQFYKTKGKFEDIIFEIEKVAPDEFLVLNTQQKRFKNLISKYNTTILENSFFENIDIQDVILKYCAQVQKDFLPELDDLIEYKLTTYLMMDDITRRNLEITRTKRYLKKKGSIFWFLNNAKTSMGSRLLKKYLNEPLLNINEINKRQEAVQELFENPKLLEQLENRLEDFCDLSRMCARISNSTIYPKDLFQIVKNSKKLSELACICEKFKSELLKINQKKLEQTLNLVSKIKAAINEDSSSELRAGGIINDNYDSQLDYLRDKLKKIYSQIEKYQEKLKKKFEISKLKISSSRPIGYYIEVPLNKQSAFQEGFYKKQALSNTVRFTTDELREFEINIGNLKFQINELEYDLYCQIRAAAAQYVETMRILAKDLARIDVLISFAKCSIKNNFVRPYFNKKGIFIKNGFHPSLLKLNNELIKNDTELQNGSMIILTGANMSGKSTYLKYNAIICVLAQIGCYVPADYAELEVVDRIFLRQGSMDDIVSNNSSFMVEMNDLKFILDNATDSSFILLDEPAKSTNADEGGAIARAYCEYFLNNYKAKTMIATHNMQLTKLETQFPKNVFNYVTGTDSEIYGDFRKIRRGIVEKSDALNTAKLACLPDEIIERAQNYLIKI